MTMINLPQNVQFGTILAPRGHVYTQKSFLMIKMYFPHQDLSFGILHVHIGLIFLKSHFRHRGRGVFSKGAAISRIAQTFEICIISHLFRLPLNYKNQS